MRKENVAEGVTRLLLEKVAQGAKNSRAHLILRKEIS